MAKADLSRAKELYPSIASGDPEWMAYFATPAGQHTMGRFLYDIYDQIKEEEERAAGRRRVGRRPTREPVSLEEVYKTIFPIQPSNEPFIPALKKLLGDTSQRAFAKRIGMSQPNFGRYLDGRLKPDVYLLEKIASALKIHPSHFVEWRAMYIGEMLTKVYLQQPHLSVKAYRALRLATKRILLEGVRA